MPIVAIAAGVAVASTTLVGQLLWTGHRRLPSQTPPSTTVLTFGAASGGDDAPSNRPRAPVRVVALGDSTLTGPGLERGEQVWLPHALATLGSSQPIEYVSLAVGGSRVADAAARVRDALVLAPDVVVVAVGANDVLHGVPLHRIRRRLDELIRSLLDRVDVVAIANVGDLGNIARVPAPLSSLARVRAARVCRAIERVVSSHERAVLLDVTPADTVFRSRSVYTPDLFHPGPDGHAAWARAVLPQLRLAVERASAQRSEPGRDPSVAQAAGRTSAGRRRRWPRSRPRRTPPPR